MILFRGGIRSTGEEQEAMCVKHTSPIHPQLRGHLAGRCKLWLAFLMQNPGVVEGRVLYSIRILGERYCGILGDQGKIKNTNLRKRQGADRPCNNRFKAFHLSVSCFYL